MNATPSNNVVTAAQVPAEQATDAPPAAQDLIEEISIDGMCGVY